MHKEPVVVPNPTFAATVYEHFGTHKPEMWELERFARRWLAEHEGEQLAMVAPDESVTEAFRRAVGERALGEAPAAPRHVSRATRRARAAAAKRLDRALTGPVYAPNRNAEPPASLETELRALGAAHRAKNRAKRARRRARQQARQAATPPPVLLCLLRAAGASESTRAARGARAAHRPCGRPRA